MQEHTAVAIPGTEELVAIGYFFIYFCGFIMQTGLH